jgi:hypothetical protein
MMSDALSNTNNTNNTNDDIIKHKNVFKLVIQSIEDNKNSFDDMLTFWGRNYSDPYSHFKHNSMSFYYDNLFDDFNQGRYKHCITFSNFLKTNNTKNFYRDLQFRSDINGIEIMRLNRTRNLYLSGITPFNEFTYDGIQDEKLMTVKYLKTVCRDNGVSNISKLNRIELIRKIMKI